MMSKIELYSWFDDGLMDFIIDGRVYTYSVDAAQLPRLVKKANYKPKEVLNEVKRICNWWAGPDGQPKPNTRRTC